MNLDSFMNSSGISRATSLVRGSWSVWLGISLLVLAFVYIWLVPFLRPRGELLGGYYRIKDIYLGIPVGVAMIVAFVVLVTPRRLRKAVSLRLIPVSIALLAAIFVSDAVYALGVMGAWWSDFWLDQAHISRKHSVPDDELGFVRKPGISWRGFVPDVNRMVEYRSDENGFRNPPGIRRAEIAFVGDSFTEAATVEEADTFVHRVGAATGRTVVNLGRGAYGPQQELIVLQRYALAYHPQAIVWQLFEGNDLKDAAIFAHWKKNPRAVSTSFTQRYLANSLIRELTLDSPEVKWFRPKAMLRYNDGSLRPTEIRYEYDPAEPVKSPIAFEETKQAIEAGYRLCESKGIKLLIVMIPTMLRVVEPYIIFDRPQDRDRYLPSPSMTENSGFSGALADFCRELGCAYVDSYQELRRLTDEGQRELYIPADEHLDIRGHEVIAQLVLEWLRSDLVVSLKTD